MASIPARSIQDLAKLSERLNAFIVDLDPSGLVVLTLLLLEVNFFLTDHAHEVGMPEALQACAQPIEQASGELVAVLIAGVPDVEVGE